MLDERPRPNPGKLTLVSIQHEKKEIAMNTTRQNFPSLGSSLLCGLLAVFFSACGGEGTSASESTATATAVQAEPGHEGHGHGVEQLDTQYDLSKLNAKPATSARRQSPDVARQTVPANGLQPASVSLKGALELEHGEQLWDFGAVRQGESREHIFELISSGQEPLIITGVKPSCGCTKADVSLLDENGAATPYEKNSEIPVGTRFQLLVEVATDGKPAGPFAAQVSLYANSPGSPMNLRLEAEIEPILVVEPSPTVYFGRITTADEMEEEILISAKRGESFGLSLKEESFAPFSEYLSVETEAVEPDAEGRAAQYKVKVKIGPNTPLGMRNCPLRFDTDIPVANPRYPSEDGTQTFHIVQVNVQAQVTGMVHADPAFISFGLVRPGEVVERQVRIECHDDFQLSTDMATSLEGLQGQEFPHADAFSMTVEPVEEGRLFLLKMRIEGLPESVNGSFGGILKIGVEHPWMKELSVRFSGVCRPGVPRTGGN